MTESNGDIPPPLPGPEVSHAKSFLEFEPTGPVWWYVLRMGGIAFLGAMLIGFGLGPFLCGSDSMIETIESDPWFFAIFAIVFAPPLETLILALFLGVSGLFTKNVVRLSIASALFWGVLHMLNSPVNGVAVLWPFYIMSRAYLAWRPLGFWKAFGVTALIHAANNTIPAMLFVLLAGPPAATPDPTYGQILP